MQQPLLVTMNRMGRVSRKTGKLLRVAFCIFVFSYSIRIFKNGCYLTGDVLTIWLAVHGTTHSPSLGADISTRIGMPSTGCSGL